MSGQDTGFSARWLATQLPAISPGGRFIVALSGGADSSALAVAMAALATELGLPVEAAHIHHGVNTHADAWQRHCQALCERIGLSLVVRRTRPDPDSRLGPEAEWRRIRYAEFEALLQNGDVLLTAHHQGDQAETLLLNMTRGSGPDGLGAIPRSRQLGQGRVWRPLLDIGPEALRDYLRDQDLDWIDDDSNSDTAMDRAYLRQAVLPVMEQRWPGIAARLARVAGHQAEVSSLLAQAAEPWLEQLRLDGHVLPWSGLRQVRPYLASVVIRHWLRRRGLSTPPGKRLDTFLEQLATAEAGSATCLAWSGHALRYFDDALWLGADAYPAPAQPCQWTGDQSLDLGPVAGGLSSAAANDATTELSVRFRSGGEQFRFSTGSPRRALKDLLREAGIPPWFREFVPLIYRGDTLVGVGHWLLDPDGQESTGNVLQTLSWQPADPVLKQLADRLGQQQHTRHDSLESPPALG
ncbi:tRNA lysidine(34) synthetase TilS [Marinihelvus fidelis]|uniref:tRNA(Ile)-lysidine synthase n=1 Tax=Marinihelvus fidelis TaxID=2613842 RepID=A0A5N0TAA5_9GAMM|nr:tRNA lysidine(34) synthetase TilS [Marinihelvus fidelis]KAA9131870.1 tRNA lysidine(34) synthetase TilS [Marinihelvus fidelis]